MDTFAAEITLSMRFSFFAGLLFLMGSSNAGAQESFTLSGQLRDADTGEDLPFAAIVAPDIEAVGTTSNVYGFYSITLPKGVHRLQFINMGYVTVEEAIDFSQDQRLDVEMSSNIEMLEEAVVASEKENSTVTSNEGSLTTIDMKDVKKITVFGGEPDIMKIVQFDPGVKPAGEGSSGFYVRGGGIDQNLILLDEAVVYNPSHLLGLFSVFNGDALKGANLYKGGMPAEFGGRASSVMDMRMKDGNSKHLTASGGLGILSARLTLEGPLVKDKSSFIVSGRRTWTDLLLSAAGGDWSTSSLFFYDFNAKVNYRFNENNRLFASGYFGRDKFGFQDQFGLNWGNATGTLRWNHILNERLFSNTSLVLSNYDYEFGLGMGEDGIAVQSVIRDVNVKQDFSYYLNNDNTLKLGFNVIHHTLEPGNLDAGNNTGLSNREADQKYGFENAVYVQNQQQLTPKLNANYGLRVSHFSQVGSGTKYTFDNDGNLLTSEDFEAGERIADYLQWEPRLSLNYAVNEMSALKLGFNRSAQYMHLLTNATSSTPTDTWIMSSNNVRPQMTNQLALGLFNTLRSGTYEFSLEGYYKDMQNLIDYRNGADVLFNELIEGDLLSGNGKAYGIEFLAKKKRGRFSGQFGYTWSRSFRQIDGINNGDKYSARQDRIHDLNIVALFQLNERVSLSSNFVYYTGDAVTFPSGRYYVDGMLVPLYTARNAERMPDYHRLDFGLTIEGKENESYTSSWSIGIYNVYGRENAFSISFEPSDNDPLVTEAVQLSLFKYVPSITYNFAFK